jgi:hypothetical protein
VKRIEIDGNKAIVQYNLPIPLEEGKQIARVLSIDTPSGDRGIRTPDLCDANAALSQLSYIPTSTIKLYHMMQHFINLLPYRLKRYFLVSHQPILLYLVSYLL